jgi:serine/threonine-protein kinase
MPLSQGEVLNKRYRIVVLLGQGGFGAVYRAWDLNLERPCAIKENLDVSVKGQEQFKREAQFLYDLSHPNLPRVIDHFYIQNRGQYLVMEYVEGKDLKTLLENRNYQPLQEEIALPWIQQICDALTYLHSQNPQIIHRDIKPANIKITPEGKAILVDFGIAKSFDPMVSTTTGAQKVTPGYAPLEQYGSGRTDQQSDVYALGATTYTLLTGCVPPPSDEIFRGITLPPKSIVELNPDVSPSISDAVSDAMKLDRQERTKSAALFKAAVLAGSADYASTLDVEDQARTVRKPYLQKRFMLLGIGGAIAIGVLLLGFFKVIPLPWINHETPQPTPFVPETEQPTSTFTPSLPQSSLTPSITLTTPLTQTPSSTGGSTTTLNPTNPSKCSNFLAVRMPTLNEIKNDMLSIWDANNLNIDDISSPSTRHYVGTADINKEYLWPYRWCTKSSSTLYQNIENMEVMFFINVEPIRDDCVFYYHYDNNTGSHCGYWATVLGGWQSNTDYELRVTYMIKEQIFDDQNYYQPGEYTHQLVISTP